jgi:hypothetical protein
MYPWAQTFVSVPPVFQNGKFPQISLSGLLEEPSLFSCCEEIVMKDGGVLTRRALQQIQEMYERPIAHAKEKGLSAIIDVRVQRLMPGMYPSIPGWHCDAVPRSGYHGQPNFSAIAPESFHVALILSSEAKGVSNTEYVQTILKPKIWDKDHVYRDLHTLVEKHHPETVIARDGQFVWFTPKTIHRTKPCVRRGVRLFMRYSLYPKPPIKNVVRGEQMVYLLSEENGW